MFGKHGRWSFFRTSFGGALLVSFVQRWPAADLINDALVMTLDPKSNYARLAGRVPD